MFALDGLTSSLCTRSTGVDPLAGPEAFAKLVELGRRFLIKVVSRSVTQVFKQISARPAWDD